MTSIATIVEGRVPADKGDRLVAAYDALSAGPLPDGLTQSFLLQDTRDETTWRVMTLWRDMAALEKMRAQPGTPAAVALFQDLDVTPNVGVFRVRAAK
jgi:quinol monooxygenase YgiN